MSSLDGLQNVRSIGGVIDAQRLEGHFGRCGRVSERFGVRHACYDRNFRFCQPLIPPGFLMNSAANIAVPAMVRVRGFRRDGDFRRARDANHRRDRQSRGARGCVSNPARRAHALRAHGHRVGTRDRAVRRCVGAGRGVCVGGDGTTPRRRRLRARRSRRRAARVVSRRPARAHALRGTRAQVRTGARKAPGDDVSRSSQNIKTPPRRPRNSPGAPRFRG